MKKLIFILITIIALFISGCAATPPSLPASPSPTENTAPAPAPQENYAGVLNTPTAKHTESALDRYMVSLKERADTINASLEKDALTQVEMNEKAQQLYELWDEALNYLWVELKNTLPEDEFAKLLDEQLTWITEKEKAAEEAGKEFEGGSMHILVVSSEAARITEERVYEFYKILNPTH